MLGAPLLVAALGAFAQVGVPDAAQLERQQRESRRAEEERERLLNPQAPALKAPPARPPSAGQSGVGPTFVLTAVEFSPSKFFTPAELDAFVKPLIGQSLDFAGAQRIVDAINAEYRERRQYIARAILPPQSVQGGLLKITLAEGRAGDSTITGVSRMNPELVRQWLAPASGEVIDVPALDLRVSRFMKATDTDTSVELNEGKVPGTSDPTFTVREPAPLGIRAYISNEGNELTGRATAGADLRWFSPLGRGDRVTAGLIYSRGAQSLSGGYAIPFNQLGGVAGLTLSHGRSKIISGPFAAIDVEGRSNANGLYVRHPAGSIGRLTFDVSAGVNRYTSENSISGFSTGEVRTRTANGALATGWRGETSEFAASVQYVSGRAEAGGGLTLPGRSTVYDASWVQRFAESTLVVQLRGQSSQTGSLPSLMQLSLGGPGTVRGYSVGTFVADSGNALSVDYHFRLGEALRGFVFADTANGRLANGGPKQSFSSVGVGGEWDFFKGTTLAASVSHAMDASLITSGSANRLSVRVTQQF